jgi:hypothetical protein
MPYEAPLCFDGVAVDNRTHAEDSAGEQANEDPLPG